ncbi:MAG TPA: hypothetical protein VNG90_04745, partial [Candidatus Acidoferrum sp.]|nr:hypothetical protein [Candidatus Acidoferrum sp.]
MLQQPTPGLMETTDGHIIVGLPTEGMAGRERFIMRGLGISPMEDQSNPDPGYQYSTSQAARHFSNLLAAAESAYPQVNTFRLELSATQYDRLSDSGRQQYIATAVGYCQEIVDRGRYPLLYCGDSQVHGKLLSFYEKAYPLYGALHRALAALPEVQVRVLYEPFGKPYGISPGEWVRSMTELISFFREVLHYTNALFIDLRDRGRAFEEPQVTDLEKHDQDVLDSLAVFKD